MLLTGILYPWQFHRGPFRNTLPQTLPRSHREHNPSCVQSSQGQPARTETGNSSQARPCSVGRAMESKQLLGCSEGFPSLEMEGKSGRSAPSHPDLHLPARDYRPPSLQRDPRVCWGPGQWQSPPYTSPAPHETARLISSPLSLPVPSGLAGGSGSNRSGETTGGHVAASHQGPWCCQGCPRNVPPSSDWSPTAKGSPKLPANP